jgi:hypothetical protein
MLFPPKGNQRGFDPISDCPEAVEAGVAGGAKGDQETGFVVAGTAMVDG